RRWGLSDLRVTGGLRTLARNWAVQLRGQGYLQHNPSLSAQISGGVTAGWRGAGENVGYGYSVDSLHAAFMNSSGHRANIL
ncbi:CAP domain-containing protein, partial [Salmonella sp. SAL4448]|uniref:CAP domain-containing protein n=1 Tax=Salmonella sp. SAL4448 TaxID=3159903 RepID=UPI00397B442E